MQLMAKLYCVSDYRTHAHPEKVMGKNWGQRCWPLLALPLSRVAHNSVEGSDVTVTQAGEAQLLGHKIRNCWLFPWWYQGLGHNCSTMWQDSSVVLFGPCS